MLGEESGGPGLEEAPLPIPGGCSPGFCWESPQVLSEGPDTVGYTVFVYSSYVNWRCIIVSREALPLSAAPSVVLTASQERGLGALSCPCRQSQVSTAAMLPRLPAHSSVSVTLVCSGLTATQQDSPCPPAAPPPCMWTPWDRGHS